MSNCCFVWRSKQNNHARDHNKTKTLGLILLHNLHTHTLFPLFTCLLHFSSFDALLLYDSLLSLLRDFFPLAPQFAELLKFTIILLDFPLSSFISLSLKSTPRRATQHTHTPTQTIRTQSAVIFPPAIIYRFARALFFCYQLSLSSSLLKQWIFALSIPLSAFSSFPLFTHGPSTHTPDIKNN